MGYMCCVIVRLRVNYMLNLWAFRSVYKVWNKVDFGLLLWGLQFNTFKELWLLAVDNLLSFQKEHFAIICYIYRIERKLFNMVVVGKMILLCLIVSLLCMWTFKE